MLILLPLGSSNVQPSKLTFLLGRHLATNSFGLGRLFYKTSRQVQNFRRHGDYKMVATWRVDVHLYFKVF